MIEPRNEEKEHVDDDYVQAPKELLDELRKRLGAI